jgi:hypothetical protein
MALVSSFIESVKVGAKVVGTAVSSTAVGVASNCGVELAVVWKIGMNVGTGADVGVIAQAAMNVAEANTKKLLIISQ